MLFTIHIEFNLSLSFFFFNYLFMIHFPNGIFYGVLTKNKRKRYKQTKNFLINEENNKLALMTNILTLKKDD